MATITEFLVKPLSRHPRQHPLAYNKVTHKYSAKYVKPEKWAIQIKHALIQERAEKQAAAAEINPIPGKPTFEIFQEEKDKLLDRVHEINALLQAHEIRFNVKNSDGSFSKDTAKNDYTPVVQVPAEGTYTITLKVKNNQGQTSTKSTGLTFRDILIVSLGDSYAAGEGNPDKAGTPSQAMLDYADQRPAKILQDIQADTKPITSEIPNVTPELNFAEWQEPLAHRSYRSGHSLAAEQVEGQYPGAYLVSTFLPLSRSGAKTDEGLIRPNSRKYYNERRLILTGFAGTAIPAKIVKEMKTKGSLDFRLETGQIDEAKTTVNTRQIDFLVLTIGGNDIKWSSNFSLLIEHDSELGKIPLSWGSKGDKKGRAELEKEINREMSKLPGKFEALNKKIRETLNPRFILLTEYPGGFFGATGKDGRVSINPECGIFKTIFDVDVDFADAKLVKELSEKLNEQLKNAAVLHNWIWVDGIAGEFAKHGYCDAETYLVSAEKSFRTQGDWYGMLHPNARGHSLYAKKIADKIRKTIQVNMDVFAPGA